MFKQVMGGRSMRCASCGLPMHIGYRDSSQSDAQMQSHVIYYCSACLADKLKLSQEEKERRRKNHFAEDPHAKLTGVPRGD